MEKYNFPRTNEQASTFPVVSNSFFFLHFFCFVTGLLQIPAAFYGLRLFRSCRSGHNSGKSEKKSSICSFQTTDSRFMFLAPTRKMPTGTSGIFILLEHQIDYMYYGSMRVKNANILALFTRILDLIIQRRFMNLITCTFKYSYVCYNILGSDTLLHNPCYNGVLDCCESF